MKSLLNKLKSRKLWMSIGSIVGCILIKVCGEPDPATNIAVIIGIVSSAITYIIGESSIDKEAVKLKAENNDEEK